MSSPTTESVSSSPVEDKRINYEKKDNEIVNVGELDDFERGFVESDLKVTERDLAEAKELARTFSLDDVHLMMQEVLAAHNRDPNFPMTTLEKIREFLANEAVFENPEKHEAIIWEMKLEAALITNNSPYNEVRAVVDNHDDPELPASTVRAWVIGTLFSCLISFINQMFEIRYPAIFVDNNVAQLLAYPLGVSWAKWMPNWTFTMFGKRIEMNPGPFNQKEHMIITIMASIAKSVPYTQYIVWVQAMPFYFNMQYARAFGYQILIAMSTNFLGYGLAGLTRRFLVYPSYCIWPKSLVTIALNSALHNDQNVPVKGPFRKLYTMSRFKFFLVAFGAMFVWFWVPEVLFNGLQEFNWMGWISPSNRDLTFWTSPRGTSLFNPLPTFDWNIVSYIIDPLVVPAFSTFNMVAGGFTGFMMAAGLWYTNTWNTGYLHPVNNKLYDHFGSTYNVSRILDDKGIFDQAKYMNYSAAYLSAANSLVYGWFFAAYSAVVTYVIFFHHRECKMGAVALWNSLRRKKNKEEEREDIIYRDVHNRLMKSYPEVSEWWYMSVLLFAAVLGFAGIAAYPTNSTLAVVPYGAIMCLLFVIPVGLVTAMTGIEVTLNVIAEFIGGMWTKGNAMEMNFFKSYGYVTCAHAIHFSNDLKLAHYAKIPPWTTFTAQLLATLISTFVTTGVMRWQLDIPNVCTADAPMKFTCPGIRTFFNASVLWGTIGPDRVFGHHGQYKELLWGWFIGFALVVILYGLLKKFPRTNLLRHLHPVVFCYGSLNMSPYSFNYYWPAVPVAWLSWMYVRRRFLDFWSKYNFVLSAAFSAGVAIAAIIIFFGLAMPGVSIDWAGNSLNDKGCGVEYQCTPFKLEKGGRFKPWWSPDMQLAPGA